MTGIGPGKHRERCSLESEAQKRESGLLQMGLQSWRRGKNWAYIQHTCNRLQEPEKPIGAHVEGTAAQREAAAETSDSRI